MSGLTHLTRLPTPLTVYRIQDKDGRGPYKPGLSHLWIDANATLATRPSFMAEFGVNIGNKALAGQALGCGFRSIKQLKAWFSSAELLKLDALGYFIVRMEADAILAESDKQLVFARNKPLNDGVGRINLIKAA